MRSASFEIVAEVGLNHGGSVETAKEMIRVAADCGVDAVKFGVFKAHEFCGLDDPLFAAFKNAELPDEAWKELKAECVKAGVVFFATPQNRSDLDILLDVGVPCIKVGSDDLTNLALLKDYSKAGLPMILSTGMADAADIYAAISVLSVPVTVLCCTSEYPCPPESANVDRITTLKRGFGVSVGFSDHTVGTTAAVMAVALGAVYFEKHFTLDKHSPGPDHHFSAEPQDLLEWVEKIREAKVMLGNGMIKPSEQELVNRGKWRRESGQRLRGGAWA